VLCPRCGSQLPEWTSRCDNCGLALIETQVAVDRKGPYRIGDVVAERYELRDRVSAGPLYWSYAAFDQEEERPVALHAVRPTLLLGEQDHERFVAKIEPLLSLEAPGVARLLRVERDEGTTLLVSELIDGLPLRALIQLRRQESLAFSASEALALLSSTADALETAAARCAHGDLRPSHVLVLEDTVRLDGFGLAAAFPPEETVRALKDDPEASGYLAPEVREGRFGDRRSDVYALAVIACELLTGRVPPALGVGLEDFLRHAPPLSEEVIRRSLSPEVATRDASPLELVEALSAVLGAETWRPPPKRAGSAEPSFPKDPALPVEAADGGTIPAISPFAYLPPSPSGVKEREADETQKTDASQVERIAATLEDETGDEGAGQAEGGGAPAISVQPAAEGTVQITADMIEPDSSVVDVAAAKEGKAAASDAVERDPAISVQPAAEGTVQITADMIEPVEEDYVTSPRGHAPERPLERSGPAGPVRDLGLDPRLVRAAKQLDSQRKTSSSSPAAAAAKPAPAVVVVAEDRLAAGEAAEEQVRTTIHRSKPWAPSTPAGRRVAAARARSAPSPEARPPSEARPQPEARPAPETRPQPEARPAPAPSDDAPPQVVVALEVRKEPQGLVRGFAGPIEIKSAGAEGAARQGPPQRGGESPSPDDQQRLPAVMVDRSLTDAFGPPMEPEEPTYRVKREDALRPPSQPASRARPGKAKSAVPWWQWLLFIALLTGALTLVGVASLWLLGAE
jgi:serine/threonine protein kinase